MTTKYQEIILLVKEEKDKASCQDGSEQASAQKSPHQRFSMPPAFIKIIWAVLVEVAIILWIGAEFFSQFFPGIASLRLAALLLSISVILCFLYIAHKLIMDKNVKKYKKPISLITMASILLVAIALWFADSAIEGKWRLENEPNVIPSVVSLHEGQYDKLTRALIYNPSDSWMYQLTLLIQVVDNKVPIESVQTSIADSPWGDKFETQRKNPVAVNVLWSLGLDSFGYDAEYPPNSGRLMILYAIAPKEMRAIWFRGTLSTNSFAKISIVEWKNTPISLNIMNDGTVLWPGPRSTSSYWNFFPNAVPLDLNFGVKAVPNNQILTNAVNSIQMPVKPFEGIRLQ